MKHYIPLITAAAVVLFAPQSATARDPFTIPGTSQVDTVGTYSGAMVASPPAKEGRPLTIDQVQRAEAIGFFTLTVPNTGLASGSAAFFSRGRIFQGGISGFADPQGGDLFAVISTSFDFTREGTVPVFAPGPPVPTPAEVLAEQIDTAQAGTGGGEWRPQVVGVTINGRLVQRIDGWTSTVADPQAPQPATFPFRYLGPAGAVQSPSDATNYNTLPTQGVIVTDQFESVEITATARGPMTATIVPPGFDRDFFGSVTRITGTATISLSFAETDDEGRDVVSQTLEFIVSGVRQTSFVLGGGGDGIF